MLKAHFALTGLSVAGAPWSLKDKRAFSLVEVVIAIGIVGFAVLAIIGTLPIGLKSAQNAETMQATGNIANQLRGQMQLLSFNPSMSGTNTIGQLSTNSLFYTTDGTPTTASSPTAYYTATFQVSGINGSAAATAANATLNTNNACSIVVNLAYPPKILNQTNTFSLFVARQLDN